MSDPQIWTPLGVFAAIMLGGMTLMTTLLTRTLNAAIEGVNSRIDGLEGNLNGRIDGVHARIDGLSGEMRAGFTAVDARFETVNTKLEHLDRDVTAISKKVFGVPGD